MTTVSLREGMCGHPHNYCLWHDTICVHIIGYNGQTDEIEL